MAGRGRPLARGQQHAPGELSPFRNLATIGPQVGPPSPPELTTRAANAMLPLKPISHASIFSGLLVPYSAVPVLP